MSSSKPLSVLFVCLGNICRSPTAHGVFEQKLVRAGLADQVSVDSAGTAAYHIGKQPDSRSQKAALERGYDLSTQRARQAIMSGVRKSSISRMRSRRLSFLIFSRLI